MQTIGQPGSAAAPGASVAADVRGELDSIRSDHLCLWPAAALPPSTQICEDLLGGGADFAHAGLATNAAHAFPDLAAVVHDWSMVNAPREIRSTSWRLSLEFCLFNRAAYDRIGGLDPAFLSLRGAGLELGFRALKAGAIVEHLPELAPAERPELPPPLREELYVLVLRHLGHQWSRYLLLRRILRGQHPLREFRAHQEAVERCRLNPAPAWEPLLTAGITRDAHSNPTVSVIIPTLGRYRYLGLGLDSLRRSSIPPAEIIVVDQNSGAERQERFYDGFADLPLRVLWQEEIGQSVARNAGLTAARSPLVLPL